VFASERTLCFDKNSNFLTNFLPEIAIKHRSLSLMFIIDRLINLPDLPGFREVLACNPSTEIALSEWDIFPCRQNKDALFHFYESAPY